MASLPVALVSFCEKIGNAVTTAGNQYGWRVQTFGSRGFNADVFVARAQLKILTGGMPGPDGTGATIRFQRPEHNRTFTVRAGGDGELGLVDENGALVDLQRFVEAVGEACDAPIRTVADLPTPLARLCEKLATAVVSTGNDNGWKVTPFGSRGFNCDVAVGSTILKVTTEGSPTPDGGGASIKLKRAGFERTFSSRATRDGNVELVDEGGKATDLQRFVEVVAEGAGVPLQAEAEMPSNLHRFYERIASAVVKAGQDNTWNVTPFGSRGFQTDVALGPTLVKLTTDAKSGPDGAGATLWLKRPGFERSFTTRLMKDGELEMVDPSGHPVDVNKLEKLIGEALGSPVEDEKDEPLPFVRLCEKIKTAVVSTGNDNGWKVKTFGKSGVNADVAVGQLIVKLTTQGEPAADGSGPTIRIARAGFERLLQIKVGKEGELDLVEGNAHVGMDKLVEIVAEACGAPLQSAAELPAPLNRLFERLASTVGTAGMDNGWRVTQFGTRGFNADLAVGGNVVKVTSETKAGPDGSGAIIRLKRPGLERSFTSRMGKDSELELTDEKGGSVPLPAFVDALKDACRF